MFSRSLPRRLRFLLGLAIAGAGLSAVVRAADPAPASSGSADQDWQAYLAVSHLEVPPPESGVERYRWFFVWARAVLPAGRDFMERHPDDGRRWDALIPLEGMFASWARALGKEPPGVVAEIDKVMSPAERTRWEKWLADGVAALLASQDATPEQRFIFESRPLASRIMAAAQPIDPDKPEWRELRADLDRMVGQHGDLHPVVGLIDAYMQCRYGDDPERGRMKAEWEEWSRSSSPQAREMARKSLDFLNLQGQAIDLRFTAADGREVDLAKLRGKVVLVDFWATWCGPCKEEIPNVVRVYDEFHDQGFEVIGITLENPGYRPGDSAEQKTARLAAAKARMLAFAAANRMPWPQFFDGLWWENPYVGRYGIQGIPAMFLIDAQGRIVSTNARGEKLAAEVKRLLGS